MDVVESVRQRLADQGPGTLLVNDLTAADLPAIGWSGSRTHLRSVSALLERVPSGEIEYLALRAPNGAPVVKGCIDYAEHPGTGTLTQLATHRDLQGLGLATQLISAAEDRIRARGLAWAVLGVEDNNPSARRLYERLGYVAYGRERASWEQEDESGNVSLYETEFELMRKPL